MQYLNDLNKMVTKQTGRLVKYAIFFSIAIIVMRYSKVDGIPHLIAKIAAYVYGISAGFAILLMFYYSHQLNKYLKELENEKKNYFQEKFYNDFFQEQRRRSQQSTQQRFEDFYKNFQDEEKKRYGSYSGQSTQTKEDKELDTYLKLMGLTRNSTVDEIKKKYRELAVKWHPDKWALNTLENQKIANRNFQLLNTAYEIIKKHKNIK